MERRTRVARVDDAAAIADVVNRAYVVERDLFIGDRTSVDEVLANLQRPDVEYLVVESAGTRSRVVGAVYVEFRGERGYFGPLGVDPEFQGAGIGKMLVRAVEDRCHSRGCRYLDMTIVSVRTALYPFYEALGFSRDGTEKEYRHPERARRSLHLVGMTKQLPASNIHRSTA